MSDSNFYQRLASFNDFSELTEDRHFTEVPKDWWVFIADIKGSTQAIEGGRYRDVNTLGAAAIVCAQNVIGEAEFPFVFGGDGATMLIDPEHLDGVRSQLCGLRSLAKNQFGILMRVGAVPVSDLGGTSIQVAKFHLAGEKTIAIFRGGGTSRADELIKNDLETYEFAEEETDEANLKGLSCRWQPIAPKRDLSLSLLVRARRDDGVYRKVLEELNRIFDGDIDQANPFNVEQARYRTIRSCLADERRYHRSMFSLKFARNALEIVCSVLIFRHRVPMAFSARDYVESLARHNDHRKFDDMLRMVLDCSENQFEEIEKYLQSMRELGLIDYGLHRANETLMTCFYHGPEDGRHIHLIDGGDGGYAIAAKQLKAQLKERAASGPNR